MKLKIISNDLFDISNRLKKIDPNYFIVFNKQNKKYQVHHQKQKGDSFAFSVEDKLDFRVIKKAIVTSCKFANKILKQIESQNKLLEQKEIENLADKYMFKFKSYIDYASQKNCDIDFNFINEKEWI